MIGVIVSVSGVDDLIGRIEGGIENMHGIVDDVVMEVALNIQDDAQALCPVNTGTLRASIAAMLSESGVAEVGTDVYYAVFVEFGTVNMAAEPFLTPAFEMHSGELNTLLAQMVMGAFS
jgi:HK97 gp10 family phage protein